MKFIAGILAVIVLCLIEAIPFGLTLLLGVHLLNIRDAIPNTYIITAALLIGFYSVLLRTSRNKKTK